MLIWELPVLIWELPVLIWQLPVLIWELPALICLIVKIKLTELGKNVRKKA